MTKLPCEICRDLLPLVRDGAASPESREAVLMHLKSCPDCRAEWDGKELPPPDLKRISSRLRRGLLKAALGLIAIGVLLGLSLSESIGMFYNFLILPSVGAAAYWATRKKAWILMPAMAVLTWIWHFIKYLAEGMEFLGALTTPFYWSIIYGLLCGLGVLIAALLHFAFRKEDFHEKGS